ncbi:hypothetical protein GCM10027564_24560 [Luteimonas notoginsengisoli]
MLPVGIEDRAVAGIESWRVLKRAHRGLDRVERFASAGKHGMAGIECGIEVGADRAFIIDAKAVAFDHAGAAVDDQGGAVLGRRRIHDDRIGDRQAPSKKLSWERPSIASFLLPSCARKAPASSAPKSARQRWQRRNC